MDRPQPQPNSPASSLRKALLSPTLGRSRKILAVLGVALLFLAFPVVISLPMLLDAIHEYWAREPFISERWKASLESDSDQIQKVRLRMVDDLLRKHRLLGKTRSEIEQLLGIPQKTPYFRDYDLVYWLGPERGFFSIDSEWLVVRFDPGQRVTEAQILRD